MAEKYEPYYYSFGTPEGLAAISNSVLAPVNAGNAAMWANNPVYPGGMPGLDVTDPTIYALMQSNPGLAAYITQQQDQNAYLQSLNPNFEMGNDYGGAFGATGWTPEQFMAAMSPYWDQIDQSIRPSIVTDVNGQQYLQQWHDVSQDGGFLDALTGLAEPVFALSGFAGPALGASIAPAAGAGALAGDALAAEIAGLTGSGVATGGPLGTGAIAGEALIGGAGSDLLGSGETFLDPWDLQADPFITYQDPSVINLGGTAGLPTTPTTPLSEVMNSDEYGNTDMGNGPTGTETVANPPTGTVTTTPTDTSALQWLANQLGVPVGALQAAGILGSTALGMMQSNQLSNSLESIANQARTDRLPFLNQATEWFTNPASYYSGAPAQAAMDATLRGLSVNGNPFGSGTSLALANEAGLRDWRNAWTGAANIGLSGQDSRNNLLASAAQADTGGLTALASGLGSLTSPPPQNSLSSLLRQLGLSGGGSSGGFNYLP